MESHSPRFPSDLRFGSFLVYPSQARTESEGRAKTLIIDVKRNAYTLRGSVIEAVVKRLAEVVPGSCLAALLDGTAALVPMPTSARLLKHAVKANHTLCEAMVEKGLGRQTLPLLLRTQQIRKSAFCKSNERPSPREHYDSFSVDTIIGPPKIILVDDVVTRGASFLGAAARLLEKFPDCEISAFAVAHTEREMPQWIAPCVGSLTCDREGLRPQRVNRPIEQV